MRQFLIYHATNIENMALYPMGLSEQPRKLVGRITASSINQAYIQSQSMNEEWHSRSTSIGDVIADGDDLYLVQGMGFRTIDISELGVANPDVYYLCLHLCDMMFVIIHSKNMVEVKALAKIDDHLIKLSSGTLEDCLGRVVKANRNRGFGGIGVTKEAIANTKYKTEEDNGTLNYNLN